MKKFIVFLGILILLGGICLVGYAVVASGFDFNFFSKNSDMIEKEYESSNAINIDLDVTNAKINISMDNGSTIRIKYYESEYIEYNITDSESLKIRQKDRFRLNFWMWNWSLNNYKFDIILPSNFDGDIIIETTNALILINEVSIRNVDIDTTNGDIILKNVNITETLEAETTNGKIELTKVSAKKIATHTTNGSINLNETISFTHTAAKTTNGKIIINKVVTETMLLKTTNSNISGTISGNLDDYQIIANTTNGSCHVPKGQGLNKLEFKTTNGSINIDFE